MSTFSAIREWATQLDYWEQAALEKIASGTVLDETDYSYLLQLCMEDYDLLTKSAARPQLTFPAKLAGDQGALPFTLERLFNLRNVGALPGGPEPHFRRETHRDLRVQRFREEQLHSTAWVCGFSPVENARSSRMREKKEPLIYLPLISSCPETVQSRQ